MSGCRRAILRRLARSRCLLIDKPHPGWISLGQFGHRGSTSHRRHTAFGAKTDIGDAPGIHLDCQLQDVATCGILDPHLGICVRQLARIAGVLEVVEKLRRIHGWFDILSLTRDVRLTPLRIIKQIWAPRTTHRDASPRCSPAPPSRCAIWASWIVWSRAPGIAPTFVPRWPMAPG